MLVEQWLLRQDMNKETRVHILHEAVCNFQSSNHHYHHHPHVTPSARISMTLPHHPSLSSTAPGRSSRVHPVSALNCCIEVLASHTTFARPCEGIHKTMSLMSSSLLLQQCPACLVRLTWIFLVMGSKWSYSCYFVECCFQDLFNIARIILV